ncbi:MAG: lysophospholipid acyltransferase family protein [Candidatus Fermentibacteraceae bacterium]|nr:lysophospholipid acyltransferase family protein [Candidatus Fermentibacteraceae bacterium]
MTFRLPFRGIRHSLQLPAVRLVVFLAGIIPGWMARPLSTLLGVLASTVPGRSREIFRINRKHVIRPSGLEVRLWKVYANLIRGILDFLRLNSRSDRTFMKSVEVRGAEHMQKALSHGRGVMAITAHYSAWELIPRAVSLLGHDVGVVTRKIGRGGAADYLDSLRSRHGTVTIDRGSGLARLMRVLRDNTAVGILIDQDTMGVESGFVDFLGLPARTPVGPARLALRFDIPVLTLHISGRGDGGYAVRIDEPLDLDGYRDDNGYMRLTADLTKRIEEWIVEDPEQWVWIHERWARRPGWAPGLQ